MCTKKPHTLLYLLKARFEKMKMEVYREREYSKQYGIHPCTFTVPALAIIYSSLKAISLCPVIFALFSQLVPFLETKTDFFLLHMAEDWGH